MRTSDNPIHDILRTAIQREIDAYTLYTSAACMVEIPHAKEILKDLAAQEVGHRHKLEALLKGEVFQVISDGQQKKVADLKITDYLVEEPLASDSDLQNILIVAGKRENASHNLYAALAKVSEDEDTTRLFEFLANEELTHKHRVESLYDEIIYKEN
ncbi:MAG TPA: ferritin family protein [Chloroflexi bacterium]|jgi:rubrerythrin|nr:ferritin family protein [Chloroflexota bacterium]